MKKIQDKFSLRFFMSTKIFINLPVQDLHRSMQFFNELGFTFNSQFTNESATMMVVSPDIYIMLLTEPFFSSFIPQHTINEPSKTKEVLVGLSAESKQEVDILVDKALHLGAVKAREPEEQEYMYTRSFLDLDNHLWEIIWMDSQFAG